MQHWLRWGACLVLHSIIVTPTTLITDDVARYAELGVDRLIINLGSQQPDHLEGQLRETERLMGVP